MWLLIRIQNRLDETVLKMGHKKCLLGEIWLIIPKLSLLPLLIWSTALLQYFLLVLLYTLFIHTKINNVDMEYDYNNSCR